MLPYLVGEKKCSDKYISLTDNNNCGVGEVNNNKIGFNIPMVTIDELNISDLTLIKLDVENYEYAVLLGAENSIKKFHPIIIIELHKTNPNYDNIIKFLQKYKYKTDAISYAHSPTFIYM